MSINNAIENALSTLEVPFSFQKHSENANTYITYFCYNEKGEEWAENEEIATGYYIQINVWSKTDYTNLVKQVKNLMINAGFIRKNEIDLYEKETETYHKAIRFFYVKK